MNSENDPRKMKRFIVIAAAVLGIALTVLFAAGRSDGFLASGGESFVSDTQGSDSAAPPESGGNSSEEQPVSEPDGESGLESGADSSAENPSDISSEPSSETERLRFRSGKLLEQHYQKHGIDMGFSSAEEYEKAAAAVPLNPDALHKTEAEDGDDVYYVESTNEFVVVSTDGYLRTYFKPDRGIDYFNRQ